MDCHLIFAGIKVKVCKSRNWHSRNLVSEHFDHIQLEAQDVRESGQTECQGEFNEAAISQINDTHLTLLPGACLLLEDLRLLDFLNFLVGDFSACLEGEEEAIETLPDNLRGFGWCGEEDKVLPGEDESEG